MASTLASRIYWVHKEAGKPLPRFSRDDYLDYLVTEALVARGEADRQRAEDQDEKDKFRKSHKGWDPLKEGGGG